MIGGPDTQHGDLCDRGASISIRQTSIDRWSDAEFQTVMLGEKTDQSGAMRSKRHSPLFMAIQMI